MGHPYSLSAEGKEFIQVIMKLLNDTDINVPSRHAFRLLPQIPKFYPSSPKVVTLNTRPLDKIDESFYVTTIQD